MKEEKVYRVYRHVCPDGKIYVGVTSQNPKSRWRKSSYLKGGGLKSHIEKYGWDNIIHEVIYTCYERDEALSVEDEMICYWREKGLCLNELRSGHITFSKTEYWKEQHTKHSEHRRKYALDYYHNHKDEHIEYRHKYDKIRSKTPERKIYKRVSAYNQHHPDNITITPAQAKFEYTNYSFVPSFIKYDDIPNAIPISPSDWEWCKNLN